MHASLVFIVACVKFNRDVPDLKLFTQDGVEIEDDELLSEPQVIGDVLKVGACMFWMNNYDGATT